METVAEATPRKPRKKRVHLYPPMRERLREMAAAGLPTAEIAAALGVCESTVIRYRRGLRADRYRERRETFLALVKAGRPFKEAAKEVGVSLAATYKWRRDAGMPVHFYTPRSKSRDAETRERLFEFVTGGLTVTEAARRLGLTLFTALRLCKKAGVTSTKAARQQYNALRSVRSTEKKREAGALMHFGYSLRAVSQAIGFSYPTAARIAAEAGLPKGVEREAVVDARLADFATALRELAGFCAACPERDGAGTPVKETEREMAFSPPAAISACATCATARLLAAYKGESLRLPEKPAQKCGRRSIKGKRNKPSKRAKRK